MKTGSQPSLFDHLDSRRFVICAVKTKFGVEHVFRFECGAVIASFCLPHGFSLNPAQMRRALEQPGQDSRCFAMPEACQPLGDGDKEVTMRWDEGSIDVAGLPSESPLQRLERSLREGVLEIELSGMKLRGAWTFERDHRGWKVRKVKDRHASSRNVLRENWSVLTRRSLPLIASEMGVHDGVRFTPHRPAAKTSFA